jgi:hypothetical protein
MLILIMVVPTDSNDETAGARARNVSPKPLKTPNTSGTDKRHKTGYTDGAPVFSDSSILHMDGWLTAADGRLLLWVPPEQRLGLFWPRTLGVIGAQPTRINLERFVHGPQWALCHTDSP